MTDLMEGTSRLLLDDVVVDMHVYPRTAPSEATINRYAEAMRAGDQFPPIVLEKGTNVLLDGLHRWKAAPLADLDTLEAEYREVPEGMPLKLYAASLSVQHGDRIPNTDLKQITRETITANPHFSQKQIADLLSLRPRTVSTWVSDITEHHRGVLKIRALILSRMGHSQQAIANILDRKRETIRDWLAEMANSPIAPISEELLREAVAAWPEENEELATVVEELREEMIFGHWSDEERELLMDLRNHHTVVVNMREKDGPHANLVPWLRDTGWLTRVDRQSPWGNPFLMPDDGDRDTVVQKYEEYYLPHKLMLLDNLPSLQGKALGCWCAPQACHGDVLAEQAEKTGH